MNRKRVLHGIGVVVVLALVIPFVVYAVPGAVGADESYVILSGSMEPEMSPGDAVIVEDRGAGSISEGDVITFSRDGSDTVVTHRVIDVREENGQQVFETKGDANDQADRRPVPAENVVGTVVLTIPWIGYVVHFVNTPLGFAATVLLPIGLFVLSEVWTLVRGSIESGEGADGSTGASVESGAEPGGPRAGGNGALAGRTEATDGGTTGVQSGSKPMPMESDTTSGEDTDREQSGFVIDATDLAATTVLLVLLTPYAAYVALQLQTLATIAIAYTVGFTAFALGSLQVAAMVQKRKSGSEPEGSGEVSAGAGAPGAMPSDVDRVGGERATADAETPVARPEMDGSTDGNADGPAPDADDESTGRDADAPADDEDRESAVADASAVEGQEPDGEEREQDVEGPEPDADERDSDAVPAKERDAQ